MSANTVAIGAVAKGVEDLAEEAQVLMVTEAMPFRPDHLWRSLAILARAVQALAEEMA